MAREPRPEAGRRRDRQRGHARAARRSEAGLKRGDVIMSFNGQPVHDTNTLRNRVADAGPGSTADVVIIRDGAREAPHRQARRGEPRTVGALRVGATASDERGGATRRRRSGIVASRRTIAHGPGRRGRRSGRPCGGRRHPAGDIIQEVNRQPVKSVDDLRAAVRKSERQADAAAHQPQRLGRRVRHGASAAEQRLNSQLSRLNSQRLRQRAGFANASRPWPVQSAVANRGPQSAIRNPQSANS